MKTEKSTGKFIVLQPRPYKYARFGLVPFRSPLLRKYFACATFFLFLLVLRCFTSQGSLPLSLQDWVTEVCSAGLPHSETSGSKVIRHLPETYRSHIASFIASRSQGIHHMLLNFLLGNLKTTFLTFLQTCYRLHSLKIFFN